MLFWISGKQALLIWESHRQITITLNLLDAIIMSFESV